ncbi:MAG: Mrp/NBP35 family ATP-binding protein [Ruminococcus sp.]|nr:Mrp/NBP35 family ATP-binding protein [Ruminococcus sp.]
MGCDNNCSSCSQNCSDRTAPQDLRESLNQFSSVKKVIGVISGKGGVGKSLVTSALAVTMNRRGKKTAILDADITGPSIPKAFNIHTRAKGNDNGIYPETSETGIDVMSINLLLENETDPVIWRGAMISGTVKQFWTDVIWANEDYMFVDMPPGTGDVALTVFQSIPVDGIIIVTSPQDLVSMIVAKAVKMAQMMNVPILGIVENMSYFMCSECGKKHSIFGDSKIEEIAAEYKTKVLAKLPIDPELASSVDNGTIENFEGDYLSEAADIIEQELNS